MRIQRNHFETWEQATAARKEFPYCGVCGSVFKIQQRGPYPRAPFDDAGMGDWMLCCMANSAHRSISSRGREREVMA